MGIDYSQLKYAKKAPRVVTAAVKRKIEHTEWRDTCQTVDARDKRVCQVTGIRLTAGAVDPLCALERHHMEPRSQSKARRFSHTNVWTVSRAVHQAIHAGALRILNKHGQPARDVREIDYAEWNRNIVPRGSEPFTVRKLPVRVEGR